MRGELFFEIPDDQEVIVRLVRAVPLSWSWVDGGLHAPKKLIVVGEAEENTGFAIARYYNTQPTIIGSYDRNEGKRREPNLFAIMVERKHPGFIAFDEAGCGYRFITLELAVQIAVGFIRKGYRGSLRFYKDCYDNSKHANSARCGMVFDPWQTTPVSLGEAKGQTAQIKLEWESRYGG